MDLQARLDRRQALHCERCPRRIAWTTFNGALRHSSAAWRWQGKGVPIRYRFEGDVPVVDLECFSCGWQATYPIIDHPLATLILLAPYIPSIEKRWAELVAS